MQFRIIETRQRVREAGERFDAGMNMINSLAAIGSAFGIRTQFLQTMTTIAGNIKSIAKNAKLLFAIKRKTYGLGSDELKLVSALKKEKDFATNTGNYIKSLFAEVQPALPAQEEEGKVFSSEEIGLLAHELAPSVGMDPAKAENAAREMIKNNPTIKDIQTLIKMAKKGSK